MSGIRTRTFPQGRKIDDRHSLGSGLMVANGWSYVKGSLLGFLMGFFLFLFISPALNLTYQIQLWLLFGCLGTCVAAACAAVRLMDHRVKRRAIRGSRRSAR